MAPANRLRGWKAGHANGAVFTRSPGLLSRCSSLTHRFGFAEHFRRQQADSALFLRAERQPDGRRNHKLAVKDPLPTSFGEDLYYRLGGWLEETEPCP